jgi:hypothetical protein
MVKRIGLRPLTEDEQAYYGPFDRIGDAVDALECRTMLVIRSAVLGTDFDTLRAAA